MLFTRWLKDSRAEKDAPKKPSGPPTRLGFEELEQRALLATTAGLWPVGGADGAVRLLAPDTGAVLSSFRPLDTAFGDYNGLIQVAVGEFNGDSVPDLVVASANPVGQFGLDSTKAGKAFAYDGASLLNGSLDLIHTFTPFANTSGPGGTSGAYVNGLNIAVGDVNGDGADDLVAGTRGGSSTAGLAEYGRLIVVGAGSAADGSGDFAIGSGDQGITPFGTTYQKGVVVTAGDFDGSGGDEIAVTRGGPVAPGNPNKTVKLKAITLSGSALSEIDLSWTGSPLAPFGGVGSGNNVLQRDARVAFVDVNGWSSPRKVDGV